MADLLCYISGQGMPASTQWRVAAANSARESGGSVRGLPWMSSPGSQAQPTSVSSALCFNSAGPSMLWFLLRSLMARQIAALDSGLSLRSCQAIDNGARCQLWLPGTPVLLAFDSWWQVAH